MQKIVKFLLLLTLVLLSISACYSSSFDCSEPAEIKSEHSSTQSDSSGHDDCATDDCVCLLTCHNFLISFSLVKMPIILTEISDHNFNYSLNTYPEIFLSEEKPPTI